MQESKYFYEGIPLSKYCKDNGININTIRSRIWKKKQSKKYEHFTEQEIVNMVVEAYGTAIKYMYKGVSLRQYCIENDINFGTINSRIVSLKKQNPDLSNDELVIVAIEEFDNKNFRFFYQGVPLVNYCKEHPEINYNTIRTFINRELEKNPNPSIEETIEKYVSKEHKGIYKYYYCGIPLVQYCEDNDLSYKNIITYINRYKNKSEFQYESDDEFVEMIMNTYQPFAPKYMYKGITLRQYCEQNNLSYYSIVSFVKRRLSKNKLLNIDDLIDEGIQTINRYGIIYYYNGVPLKDYCIENNLNASSIRCAIFRKQSKTNLPLQEIVNDCVESYQKFTIKYYYDGESLLSYCNKIGLNYNTVIQVYLDKYSSKSDVSTDDTIKEIVDYYIEHPPIKTKYYFGEQSLAKFCNENGYSYFAIWSRIKALENKDELENTEQRIEQSIKKYEERLEIKKINETFEQLKQGKINSSEEIIEICEFLKVDYENVLDLINMNFSYNQAINMIWYFSDKTNSQNYKLITDKKVKKLFSFVEQIKQSSEKNINDFELYDLIGIYKSELYDARNEILLRQKRYIYKTIYSLCSNHNITVNKNNFEDFESEIKMYLIILLNRTNLNIYGQIIKYMDLTIKGYFRTYLRNYKKQNVSLSLDDTKFSKDKGIKNSKSRIDYIADPKNQYTELEETSFSSNMMKVLSNLSQQDLSFVMLKFQENYNDDELAEYFHINIDEIKEKENSILSMLKNDDSIKVMKKTKKEI